MVCGDAVPVVRDPVVAMRFGFSCDAEIYETISSIVRMLWRVIMFRTSARMEREVRPNRVAVRPISNQIPLHRRADEVYFGYVFSDSATVAQLDDGVDGSFFVNPFQETSAEERSVRI